MSESDGESQPGISDDQLPEELVPSEDNPLAEGLEDGETPGDLMGEGRPAAEDSDEDDEDETGTEA